MRVRCFVLFLFVVLLSGCVTLEEPVVSVEDPNEAMVFLKPGLRPEVMLFPEYLLMEGFELSQHGIIPETSIVGAGMRGDMDLRVVRRNFSDKLTTNHWTIDTVEVGKQSFRMMASLKGETIEIRAVQGSGPTQIFILYRLQPVAEPQLYN